LVSQEKEDALMNRSVGVAALAVLGLCLGWTRTVGAEEKTKTDAADPTKFVMLASAAGLAEVNLGKIAAERASSAEVKKFGQRMVDDHTKANKELNALADKKKIPPAQSMDATHRQAAERMAQLTGADFDREFMRQMVKDHKEAVSLFESQSKNGRDEDLKALAGKMLPTLRHHLKMAQEMADTGKGSEKR